MINDLKKNKFKSKEISKKQLPVSSQENSFTDKSEDLPQSNDEKSIENEKKNRLDPKSIKSKHLKVPKQRYGSYDDEEDDSDNFDDMNYYSDNWLLKWCILKENRTKLCRKAFDFYDQNQKGYLNMNELIQAINSIVNLNNFKNSYLISVLNLCEVRNGGGVDLRMFNILTALAYRINHLDDMWFKNILPQLDMSTIENKVFKVRNLWNYLVDKRTRTINIRDLLIEFEAGGVTREHVEYAREKFKDKMHFDLLDYLTFIPLFVYMHDRIVLNPLEKKRDI